MFISREDYEVLVKKSEGHHEEISDYYKKEFKNLNTTIEDLKLAHSKEIKNLTDTFELGIELKDNEVEDKVYKATKKLREDLAVSVAKEGLATKEVEILTKAFENLGFDVKDMKDILNKLVDGVVSKNQIQLLGTGK